MEFTKHQNDLRSQRSANRALGLIVGGLVLSQLLLLAVIVSIVGSERTIIVPPNIDRKFWVTKDKASREYLEEMAGYVSWLVLDVTPSTVDWKRNVLLNWVAPVLVGVGEVVDQVRRQPCHHRRGARDAGSVSAPGGGPTGDRR